MSKNIKGLYKIDEVQLSSIQSECPEVKITLIKGYKTYDFGNNGFVLINITTLECIFINDDLDLISVLSAKGVYVSVYHSRVKVFLPGRTVALGRLVVAVDELKKANCLVCVNSIITWLIKNYGKLEVHHRFSQSDNRIEALQIVYKGQRHKNYTQASANVDLVSTYFSFHKNCANCSITGAQETLVKSSYCICNNCCKTDTF